MRRCAANNAKSKIRSRVEHVFAEQKDRMGLFIRTIGIARATTKIGMANLVYNIKRFIFLRKVALGDPACVSKATYSTEYPIAIRLNQWLVSADISPAEITSLIEPFTFVPLRRSQSDPLPRLMLRPIPNASSVPNGLISGRG